MNSSELVNAIQNPALGSLAIWQFVVGYTSASGNKVPLDYIYMVLPLVSNPEMRDIICHTRGGILAYRTKLAKDNKSNVIISAVSMIPQRMQNATFKRLNSKITRRTLYMAIPGQVSPL